MPFLKFSSYDVASSLLMAVGLAIGWIGRSTLGNKAASGTEIIKEFGHSRRRMNVSTRW